VGAEDLSVHRRSVTSDRHRREARWSPVGLRSRGV